MILGLCSEWLIHGRQWRRGRNHREKLRRDGGLEADSIRLRKQSRGGLRAKISQRKSARTSAIETSRQSHVSRTLVGTSHPIQCVLNVVRSRKAAHIRFEHVRAFRLALQIRGPAYTPRGPVRVL